MDAIIKVVVVPFISDAPELTSVYNFEYTVYVDEMAVRNGLAKTQEEVWTKLAKRPIILKGE